jgi:hypothetical protein
MILRFLQTNWLGMLLVAGLSLIPILILNARLDATTADLRAEKTLTASLSSSLALQNKGIEAMAKAANANREAYEAGLKAAEKQAVRLTIEAEDILKLPPPPTPEQACEYAADVLRGVTQ